MLRRHSMSGLTLLLGLTAAAAPAAELIGVVIENNRPVEARAVCLERVDRSWGRHKISGKGGWFRFEAVPVDGSSSEFFLSCSAQPPTTAPTPLECTAANNATRQRVRLGPGTNNINCRP